MKRVKFACTIFIAIFFVFELIIFIFSNRTSAQTPWTCQCQREVGQKFEFFKVEGETEQEAKNACLAKNAQPTTCTGPTTPTAPAKPQEPSELFAPAEKTVTLDSPIGRITISELLGTKIIPGFLGVVGAFAVAAIIWGGFGYITAMGSEEKIKAARATITYAVIGLIFVLISWMFVNTVINIVAK